MLTQSIRSNTPKIEQFLTRVAPTVARAFKAAFDFAKGAIEETIRVLGPPIREFRAAFERLAGGLGTVFDKPKNAAEGFGRAVAGANASLIGLALQGMAKVADGVAKLIPVFLRLSAHIAEAAAGFIGFVRSMLFALPPLLGAAASVAHALGFDGVGDKLDAAKTAIANFGKDAQANLDAFAQSALNAASSFDDAVTRVLKSQDDTLRLQRDLNSDNPNVASRAQNAIVDRATKKLAPAAHKAGQDYSVSLAKGLDDGRKALIDAAQKSIDAISAVFERAKSRLQALVSASLSLRQNVTSALQQGSALTDIFQGPDLNANGAFGRQNNFGRVRDFLQRRVAQERRFVLELRALMKQGLDPSLVAQIAGAGVDGGQRIAEAILSGGKGGIGQVNSLERQIASLANTTGKSVADQHYAAQIAEQRRNTEVIGYKLDRAEARLAAIQKNTTPPGGTVAKSLAATAHRTGT
jgi:hypothetical protein